MKQKRVTLLIVKLLADHMGLMYIDTTYIYDF